jgi:hypothetical protein
MRVDWYYRHIFLSVLLGQAYAYAYVNVLISPYSYSHGIIRPYNHKKRAFRFRQTTQQLFLSSSSAVFVSACDASKSKSKEAQLLISSEEEETATATIAFAASLVSYQCAEDRLRNALEAFDALKISYDVRGLLEDYVVVGDHDDNDDKTEYKYDNIVDMFLSALASTTVGRTDLQAGFSTCADLLLALHDDNDDNAGTFTVTGNNTIRNDNEDALFFKPPTRSLIGTIDGMDVTLLRDKEDVHRRFSMLFSVDRAKGLKIARLHAEIDEKGTVHIRGLYVQEAHRKKGLSTLLLAFFSHFCFVAFGAYPRTLVMNKPVLCVSLSSLGFIAENEKWPAFVAQHEKDKDITVMMAAEESFDLGPRFPHAVRRAQKIELVSELPQGSSSSSSSSSRKIYVLTKFKPPVRIEGLDPVERRLENSQHQLYSARIVAFLSTLDNAKDPMFRRSRRLVQCKR